MKKLYFAPLLCLLFAVYSHAQIYTYIMDYNNLAAMISDDGVFFTNTGMGYAAYEIPKGSGNHTVFSTAFWMSGLDSGGGIHTACNTYTGTYDLFAGPIADDYNSTYYTNTYMKSIWLVTQNDITLHQTQYMTPGYVPSAAIADWPGNGNVSEGIASQLAPYVDVNHDNIYNPMDGDYPFIQGDEAVYVILNDEAGVHANSGGNAFGIEIHVMFFVYSSDDAVNNTTFMHVQAFNRRSTDYFDFRFGLFMDPDLGYSNDDYIGCDSARSIAYVYNADNFDEGGSGQPGYGSGPPAFGVKMLNGTAGSVMTYSNGAGVNGDPTLPTDYYNYMQSNYLNGVHLTNGTTETNFVYSGDPYVGGWTEYGEGNSSGDRRILISSEAQDFGAGEHMCYNFAFIYNRDSSSHIANAHALLETGDFIQNFYDNNIVPCNQAYAEIDQPSIAPGIVFYPNPTTGSLFVQVDNETNLAVYDLGGKLTGTYFLTGSQNIQLDLETGLYILVFKTGDQISYQKLEIKK